MSIYALDRKNCGICLFWIFVLTLYGLWGMLMNYAFYKTVKYNFINNTNFSMWLFAFINNAFIWLSIIPSIILMSLPQCIKNYNKCIIYTKYVYSGICIFTLYFPLYIIESFMQNGFSFYNPFTMVSIVYATCSLCKMLPAFIVVCCIFMKPEDIKLIIKKNKLLIYENIELRGTEFKLYPIMEQP
jgi:hypothetical protein